MYLAIDTATDTASLAIIRDSQVLAEVTWCCRQNHSVELMPCLTRLLEQARLSLSSLSGIIVARGPGSFNGLRVGISTAKGLAFSLGVPLAGISTLEAAAYEHAESGLPVCPILNAGRGEIAAAIYQQKAGHWRQISAQHITTVDALCSKITTRTIFCGEATPDILKQLEDKLGQKAIIPTPASRLRRAGFLAELGLKRLKAGDYDQPATLQPIYLRRPAITQPKQKTVMAEISSNIKNKKPESNARAVIWDMDGVIINSAPYHLAAWQEVFKKRGHKFTEDDFRNTFGQRNDTIIGSVLGKEATKEEIEAIGREKEASFRLKIREKLRPLPGVVALIQALAQKGFRMAIASSAPRENIELIMSALGIRRFFQAVISDQDVTKGKPEPQGFLLAAEKLGTNQENCIVIEDAIAGVTAARRAGMHCLAVTGSHPRESLKEADLVVDSLEEARLGDIERLINSQGGLKVD